MKSLAEPRRQIGTSLPLIRKGGPFPHEKAAVLSKIRAYFEHRPENQRSHYDLPPEVQPAEGKRIFKSLHSRNTDQKAVAAFLAAPKLSQREQKAFGLLHKYGQDKGLLSQL